MPDADATRDTAGSISPAPAVDFKALYRKLEAALAAIEQTDDISKTLEQILDTLVSSFHDELGFQGGRIYRREGNDFFLCCGFGSSRDAPPGLRVPPDYAPHLRTLDEGLLIMRPGEPGYDEAFERSIGVTSTFAAIAVGEGNQYVIAFSIDGEVQEERVLYSLTAVRHVINLKIQQQKFTGMLEESRAIQESMLPVSPPRFAGFDIDGRSRSAEVVSGDLYDYLPLASGLLGLAIADASGHGVPAALMARDVITGLRMTAGEGKDLAGTIGRLNQVVHRAALASKFVSLFYAEMATDGTLAYCNAGHNAPLLLREDAFLELKPGGPVLGPIPGARYQVGQERLRRGDTLILFTDGVVDREDAEGRPFGTARLQALLREAPQASAGALADAVLAAADAHAQAAPQHDDMTVLVVRRI